MAVRDVLLFPDPRLKTVCLEMPGVDASAAQLLKDLSDTLDAMPGVGLAAPQIGDLRRAVVVDVSRVPPRKGKSPPPHHGRLALINPRITRREGDLTFREGCLSIPDYLADVRRAAFVRVEGINVQGHPTVIETEGFEAVALQHEIDHLDGLLFLDHVANLKTDLFRRKTTPGPEK